MAQQGAPTNNPNQASQTNPPKKGGMAARYRKWADRWGPRVLITIFVVLFIMLALFKRVFIFVGPGEQGVLYHRITGTDLENAYTEGLTLILPFDKMHIYDVRAQYVNDEFHVLSKDGLTIDLGITIRFAPQRDSLPFLHVEVGPDYVEKVVKPEIQAALRVLMGQYTPDEIYTSQDSIIRRTVETAQPELLERHVLLDDLLIKTITLPKAVQESIESKLRQQQAFLEYEFRIQREERERERKAIEAEGIQQFQSIIQSDGGDFSRFLDYLGIQATLALATSPNSKVVLIGNKDNGLPLIMNLGNQNTNNGSPIISTNSPSTVSTNRASGYTNVMPRISFSQPPTRQNTTHTNTTLPQSFENLQSLARSAYEQLNQSSMSSPLSKSN